MVSIWLPWPIGQMLSSVNLYATLLYSPATSLSSTNVIILVCTFRIRFGSLGTVFITSSSIFIGFTSRLLLRNYSPSFQANVEGAGAGDGEDAQGRGARQQGDYV